MTAQTHSDEPGFADLGAETHVTEQGPEHEPATPAQRAATPGAGAGDLAEPGRSTEPTKQAEPVGPAEPITQTEPTGPTDSLKSTAADPSPSGESLTATIAELIDHADHAGPGAPPPPGPPIRPATEPLIRAAPEEPPVPAPRARRVATPRGVILASLASLGLCTTIALIAAGFRPNPATPATTQAFALTLPGAAPAAAPAPTDPTRLRIPAIDLDTSIAPLPAHTPADRTHASWLRPATPGAPGTAVIAARAGTQRDPATFHALAALQKNDTITLDRADGKTLTFTVDSVHNARLRACDAASLATVSHPAAAQAAAPELDLVACGTTYDERHHRYRHNLVVTAHLTGAPH